MGVAAVWGKNRRGSAGRWSRRGCVGGVERDGGWGLAVQVWRGCNAGRVVQEGQCKRGFASGVQQKGAMQERQ